MFIVSDKNCPSCGVKGNIWKKNPEILICPLCNTIFSEFGFVSLGDKQEVHFS